MYVGVTPLLHTIRGVEQFTYRLPDDATVVVGQVVLVPWRSQQVYGVITAATKVLAFKRAKTITTVTPLILPQRYVQFLQWFAKFYAISLSHALKYALPTLPRRRPIALPKSTAVASSLANIAFTPTPSLKAVVKKLFLKSKLHTIISAADSDFVQIVRTILADKHNWPCAIIVPEEIMIAQWQVLLADYSPIAVSAHVGQVALRKAWLSMLTGQRALYLGTKRLSLFPLTEVKHIIVVHPEDPAHKQWDLNPRYHVQRLTDWLAQQAAVQTTYLSYAPRVEQYATHPLNIELLAHFKFPRMRFVAMQQQALLATQAIERLAEAQVPVVWYQRKGRNRLLVCRACSAVFTQVTLVQCSTCHSPDLQPRSLGTTSVVEHLRTLFPQRLIIEITAEHKSITIPYAEHPIIVMTSAGKHVVDWTQVDYAVIALVDHLLGLANFRAHEYAYQQLVWLRNHVPVLDIQTYVPEHPVFQALQQPWPDQWYTNTLMQRHAFYYPPAADYMMLRHTKTHEQKRLKTLVNLPADPAWIIDREL